MEFLRRMWLQVQAQLGKLPPGTKILIGSLVTVVLLVILLVSLWAGQPSTSTLTGVPLDRQPAVLASLQSAGITAEAKNGQIVVPVSRMDDAYAILAMGDLLAGNTSAAFDEMTKNQNPWTSSYQNAQQFNFAKQRVLGKIIGKMKDVHSADVIVSMPENKGFGATFVRPSASVTMLMRGSGSVNRKLVEAVAGLVSGAVAGMQSSDVVVIDANQGRQFTVKSPDDFSGGGDTLETVFALEQYHQTKIREALRYIPDVIVAVNVRTDAILAKNVIETKYDNEPLKKTDEEETENRNTADSGEPGARPNTGLDIAGSGGTTTVSRTSRTTTEYNDKPILSQTKSVVAGQTKQINVTVNVPRGYFVSMFRQSNPADPASTEPPAEPDDAMLRAIVDQQLQQIQAQVKPLISTDAEGVVSVHMIPDARALMAMMPATPKEASSGVQLVFESALTKPVGLGLLALASLALMFGMVRKATQQAALPSAQELAGVPPPLPLEDDLIGEADAQEPSMAGMELDEEDIRTRKVAEQIADMVKGNPTEAAALFNRWIRKEE